MRLTQEQREHLKTTLKALADDAKIYLFGSRVDDRKRGGDIDLLVVSRTLTKKDLRRLRVEFCKRFGEQKIDIVLDNGEMKDPFIRLIFRQAIPL